MTNEYNFHFDPKFGIVFTMPGFDKHGLPLPVEHSISVPAAVRMCNQLTRILIEHGHELNLPDPVGDTSTIDHRGL